MAAELNRITYVGRDVLAVICEDHGEAHNQYILREGTHISNTHLLVALDENESIGLEQAMDRHNIERHGFSPRTTATN